MTKKIAITGALGHIGSKLIHSPLLANSNIKEVRLIDNFLTQRYPSLFNLPKDIKYKFFEEDINSADLDILFKDIDIVVHLAAITDAASSFGNQKEIEVVNFEGTNKVIDACAKNDCKLVFPSSTSIYGSNKDNVDADSGDEDVNPQSPYAESKYKSENILNNLSKDHELDYCILRLGTIFGPSIGMRFHTAVNKFCWQANFNKPITVWSSALHQKRPYLGINDAISAIYFIIENDLCKKDTFDVVTQNFSVNDVINILKEIHKSVKIEFIDSEIMNDYSFSVSTKKIRDLGMIFEDDLKEQIKETAKILKNYDL